MVHRQQEQSAVGQRQPAGNFVCVRVSMCVCLKRAPSKRLLAGFYSLCRQPRCNAPQTRRVITKSKQPHTPGYLRQLCSHEIKVIEAAGPPVTALIDRPLNSGCCRGPLVVVVARDAPTVQCSEK